MSELEQYKGHHVVIRALPRLLTRFPELIYDVVGDGNDRPVLEALAAEVGVAHAVRFHGVVPEDALARHYAQSSIFVMPSRSEGFGFVFLEAMAHEKPVVAGNQDAATEVVRDGETGFLVDPTNVQEVTDRIERLLLDPDLGRQMGMRGAEVARSRFSFDLFSRTLLTYLSQTAGERSAREKKGAWSEPENR
jgi:phosphatidylinositol alpha-1,6-mannosyltransferase